jgi:prepilin-type N-terminal cleavage/methylation domain-containing protein
MSRREDPALSETSRLLRKLGAAAGYSLIEVLTVLGVISILLAISAPTIQGHLALQEVRGAAQEVVQVLRDTRDSAMNEGVPRYVLFNPDVTPRTYQVFRYDAALEKWTEDGQKMSLPGSVEFDESDVTFPTVLNAPAGTTETVPEHAAYFDTRGRYPFLAGAPQSYTLTLRGGLGRTVTLTLWRNTGQVTGL